MKRGLIIFSIVLFVLILNFVTITIEAKNTKVQWSAERCNNGGCQLRNISIEKNGQRYPLVNCTNCNIGIPGDTAPTYGIIEFKNVDLTGGQVYAYFEGCGDKGPGCYRAISNAGTCDGGCMTGPSGPRTINSWLVNKTNVYFWGIEDRYCGSCDAMGRGDVSIALAMETYEPCPGIIFSEDFSTDPNTNGKWNLIEKTDPAYSCFNDAANNQFYLTKNVNSQRCRIEAKNAILNNDRWIAEFDYKVSGSADGIGIHPFGPLPQNPLIWIDIFKNSPSYSCDENVPNIGIYRNGDFCNIQVRKIDSRFNDNNFHHLTLNFNNNNLKIKVDNDATYLIDTIISAPTIGSSFQISAATGSYNAFHIIKNFTITNYACSAKNCSDYYGRCGSNLENGVGGYLDCSTNCAPLGQLCNATSGYCYVPPTTKTCSNENQIIMRLNSDKNTNGALWNQTSAGYSICYNELFGRTYDKNIHVCTGENDPILYLNSINNALASITRSEEYNIPVCFGNLTCKPSTNSRTNGLVAYYSFNNNSNDDSTNENNGVTNGAFLSRGMFSSAYYFDGLDDYVSVSDSPAISLTKNMSFGLWVYMEKYPTNWQGIIGKIFNDNNGEFSFRILNATIAQFYYGKGTTPIILDWNPSADLPLNQWVHIIGVRDGTKIKLYFNGVKKEEMSYSGDFAIDTNAPLTIGAQKYNDSSGISVYFNGSIDEVKLWDRALSEQEISNEYHNYCESGSPIVRLGNTIEAPISNASNFNYPVAICCSEKITTIAGNTYWQNMNGSAITNANIGDSVLMIINRTDVSNKNISYEVYKENGNSFLFFFKWDKLVGQLSSIGFSKWSINETGKFYFKASVEGYEDVYSSNNLTVGDYENSPPSIKIIKPVEDSSYVINSLTGLTNPISFEQTSSDVDDMIDVYWNFDDGNSIRLYNCNNGTSNCNTTHQYNSTYAGTRVVNATAVEQERDNFEYDLSRFFVYKEGLNLFIIIDSPNYKLRELPAVILVNATRTQIANCSLTSAICSAGGTRTCSEITDSVNVANKLYCYTYAKSDNPKFKFIWTLDGSTNPNYPTNASPFPIILSQGGKHNIGLTVSFNMSN